MTRTRSHADWSALMFDSWRLSADAGLVIALRAMRLMAGGPAAGREARRMFGEKVEAGFELAGAIASGRVTGPEAVARKTLTIYGKRVRGNRKRLG